MVGTISGGKKAAQTNIEKYGDDFYSNIGRKGGQNGHTGGFASNRALAMVAGAKGGRRSKRGPGLQKKLDENAEDIIAMRENGSSMRQIAEEYGVSLGTIKRWLLNQED